MVVEYLALRLAALGLSLMLAWLVLRRGMEYRQTMNFGVRLLAPPHTIALFGLLSAMTILAFTAPVLQRYTTWLDGAQPAMAIGAVSCLLPVLVIGIDRLAYDRRWKLRWCACWIVFSHAMIWGVEALQ